MARSKIFSSNRNSLTVGTSAYSAGDALGVKTSFKVPEHGTIKSIVVTDADDKTALDITFDFFEVEPTGIAANAAYALADADVEKIIGFHTQDGSAVVHDTINNKVYHNETNIPYHAPSSVLWMQAELDAGSPTFTDTDDLKVMLMIEHE